MGAFSQWNCLSKKWGSAAAAQIKLSETQVWSRGGWWYPSVWGGQFSKDTAGESPEGFWQGWTMFFLSPSMGTNVLLLSAGTYFLSFLLSPNDKVAMILSIALDLWKLKYMESFKVKDGLGCVTAVTHSLACVCLGEDQCTQQYLKLSAVMLFC